MVHPTLAHFPDTGTQDPSKTAGEVSSPRRDGSQSGSALQPAVNNCPQCGAHLHRSDSSRLADATPDPGAPHHGHDGSVPHHSTAPQSLDGSAIPQADERSAEEADGRWDDRTSEGSQRAANPPETTGDLPAGHEVDEGRAAKSPLTLFIEAAGREPARIPLDRAVTTIGRDAGNDFVVADDPYVSRQHIQLENVDGKLVLRSLSRSNGTFLRIDGAVPLEPGACFVAGRTRFRVEASS